MADAVVGALRVVLGADTGKLEDGLKSTSSLLDKFGKQFQSVSASVVAQGNLISGAFEKVSRTIIDTLQGSIDKIVQLGKAAQKAGTDIESFSVLAGVASKVGLSIDDLSTALAKLGRNIAEVAGGNRTSDAAKAFQILGINVRDSSGQIKTSSDVYAEAADKLSAYKEGANKTAIEVALFGRGGAEMAAMLNKGSDAITKQHDEMEKLGLIIDQKTFKSAEAFNKEIHTMSSVIDSVVVRITVALLPVMQQLTTQFADSAKEMKSWEGTAYLIDGVVKVISTGFAGLSAVLFYNTDLFGRIFKALYTA